MKFLGTLFLILSLTACDGKAWEAYSNPETFSGYKPEVHICVGIDEAAAQLYTVMEQVKTEEQKDAIINRLQAYVAKDKSFTILQSATEFLYEAQQDGQQIDQQRFVEAVMKACVQRYGAISDRNHV